MVTQDQTFNTNNLIQMQLFTLKISIKISSSG